MFYKDKAETILITFEYYNNGGDIFSTSMYAVTGGTAMCAVTGGTAMYAVTGGTAMYAVIGGTAM
jgi:hypothetical protein